MFWTALQDYPISASLVCFPSNSKPKDQKRDRNIYIYIIHLDSLDGLYIYNYIYIIIYIYIMILYFDLFLEVAIHTWFSVLAKLLSMDGSKKWTCCSWWAPRTPLKSFRTKPKKKVTVPSKTGYIMLIHFEGLRQHKITSIYLESIGFCRFSPLQPTQLKRTHGRAQARVAAPCVPPLWTRSHGSFLKFAVENHW